MGKRVALAVFVLFVGACGGSPSTGMDAAVPCGNGTLDPGEQCDDGALNGAATDGCKVDCTFACADPAADCTAPACQVATCSEAHVCQFAADASKDGVTCGSGLACNAGTCVSASCGDGIVDAGEQCDFGADNGAGSGCETTCMFSCALISGACDDGNPCNGLESCAANTVNGHAGQHCLTGTPENDGVSCDVGKICLNMACTLGVCGDSFVTAPEECDDANQTPGDGCENNCTYSCVSTDVTRNCTPADACAGQGTCNDNTHVCAAGTPLTNNTPCGTGGYCYNSVCTQPVCGNGVLELGETCDDGLLNGTVGDGCKSNCTYVCVTPATDCGSAPQCEKESCTAQHTCLAVADPLQNTMACGSPGMTCNNGACSGSGSVCGNGVVESSEQCDFGAGNGPGTGCESNCTFSCSASPNSCDDGNPCNGAETCGSVVVSGHTGKKCSAGTPEANGTTCGTGKICLSQLCKTSMCGDGYLDMGAGESCEPPSTSTCDASCHLIVCGDGIRAGTEQCDDGNPTNLDGCSASCKFEQLQRMNSLSVAFNTDAYCTKNALGAGATGSIAQGQINSAITTGVGDGSITVTFDALGLDDLTGTSDPALFMGILGGSPQTGSTPYKGATDLDWWYTTDANTIDGTRTAKTQVPAVIASKVLTAGPAEMSFTVNFVGVAVTMDLLAARFRANIGATSTPTVSSGITPGHTAAEHVDPALVSFASMTAGELCGNTTAASLANVLMPSSLVGCGFGKCTQCYTTANTLLDLYVSGCDVFLVGQQVKATQPDAARVTGDVYKFTANAAHVVTSCTKNNVADTLADCYANAAYSSFFKFTTDRVIAK